MFYNTTEHAIRCIMCHNVSQWKLQCTGSYTLKTAREQARKFVFLEVKHTVGSFLFLLTRKPMKLNTGAGPFQSVKLICACVSREDIWLVVCLDAAVWARGKGSSTLQDFYSHIRLLHITLHDLRLQNLGNNIKSSGPHSWNVSRTYLCVNCEQNRIYAFRHSLKC